MYYRRNLVDFHEESRKGTLVFGLVIRIRQEQRIRIRSSRYYYYKLRNTLSNTFVRNEETERNKYRWLTECTMIRLVSMLEIKLITKSTNRELRLAVRL